MGNAREVGIDTRQTACSGESRERCGGMTCVHCSWPTHQWWLRVSLHRSFLSSRQAPRQLPQRCRWVTTLKTTARACGSHGLQAAKGPRLPRCHRRPGRAELATSLPGPGVKAGRVDRPRSGVRVPYINQVPSPPAIVGEWPGPSPIRPEWLLVSPPAGRLARRLLVSSATSAGPITARLIASGICAGVAAADAQRALAQCTTTC